MACAALIWCICVVSASGCTKQAEMGTVSGALTERLQTASRRYSQAISRLSLSERPEPTLCVSLASGSPHVIAPDGSSKPLQVPCTGQVSAIIERSEQYILVAAHSGSILIVDPKGFGVLDAIQVWLGHALLVYTTTGTSCTLSDMLSVQSEGLSV